MTAKERSARDYADPVKRARQIEYVKAYQRTVKGKNANRRANTKYESTEKGKAMRAKANLTRAAYALTPKGKGANAQAALKYRLSPKGKIAFARAGKKYRAKKRAERLALKMERNVQTIDRK